MEKHCRRKGQRGAARLGGEKRGGLCRRANDSGITGFAPNPHLLSPTKSPPCPIDRWIVVRQSWTISHDPTRLIALQQRLHLPPVQGSDELRLGLNCLLPVAQKSASTSNVGARFDEPHCSAVSLRSEPVPPCQDSSCESAFHRWAECYRIDSGKEEKKPQSDVVNRKVTKRCFSWRPAYRLRSPSVPDRRRIQP